MMTNQLSTLKRERTKQKDIFSYHLHTYLQMKTAVSDEFLKDGK